MCPLSLAQSRLQHHSLLQPPICWVFSLHLSTMTRSTFYVEIIVNFQKLKSEVLHPSKTLQCFPIILKYKSFIMTPVICIFSSVLFLISPGLSSPFLTRFKLECASANSQSMLSSCQPRTAVCIFPSGIFYFLVPHLVGSSFRPQLKHCFLLAIFPTHSMKSHLQPLSSVLTLCFCSSQY